MMDDRDTRRQFTREFKVQAVEMVLKGDKKATEVARNLGIRVELLYRWKNEYLMNHVGKKHCANPIVSDLNCTCVKVCHYQIVS